MAQHRYRQNKIKREHTIIDGLLPILERIAEHPKVHGITPGRINKRTSNRNTTVTFQYKTETGLKLLARSSTAVQEVFVVTDHPDQVLKDLTKNRLVKGSDRKPEPSAPSSSGDKSSNDPNAKGEGQGKRPENGRRRTRRSRPKGRPNQDAQKGPAASARRDQRPVEDPNGDRNEAQVEQSEQAENRGAENQGAETQPPEPKRPKKPEVADAIDPELQERLKSMVRKGAGNASPAPNKRQNKPTHVWRDLVKTHRGLLALDESLDE